MIMGTAFFLRTRSGRLISLLMVSLLTTVNLVACQPPDHSESALPSNESVSEPIDTPIVINDDTVTMAADYILNIKPSRYQPSLGLQGVTEPIKQTKFHVLHNVSVERVLVTKGEWVKAGTPLLVLKRQIEPVPIDSQNDAIKSVQPKKTDSPDSKEKQQNIKNQTARTKTDNQRNTETDKASDTDAISTQTPNKPSLEDVVTNTHAKPNNIDDSTSKGVSTDTLITVRASFSGVINTLPQKGDIVSAKDGPVLTMSDDTHLRFIATLPIQAKPQLSVGQTVNFTTKDYKDTFTGQISHLIIGNQPNELLVYVHVVNNELSRDKLAPDMLVSGRVNYGQIEVGAIVPERGIHDADLSALQSPPYQPLTPLKANVWIIKQDQRLTRQPVEVIEYNPTTGQYLIAGISNDSLICLADLPIESAGKKAVVS